MNTPQLLTLHHAARLTLDRMPDDYKGCNDRCVVMTPETVVLDIIQCLENGNSKHTKRIARVTFMLRFFEHTLSNQTLDRLERVLRKVKNAKQTDDRECLDSLLAEVNQRRAPFGEPIVFDKLDPFGEFTPPKKQALHDACKKTVNEDGFVYDVFTSVAVISYYQLLQQSNQSPIREMLLKRSKLVLKGGAATGKFLFKANKKLWQTMSADEKRFATDNFIKGGDNDMSIAFDHISEMYDTNTVNNEIGSMLYDMQMHIMTNVRLFNVKGIIDAYLQRVELSSTEYGGKRFVFHKRDAMSFAIADRNPRQNEIVFTGSAADRLFGSLSYLEFANKTGGMTKFHLARVKAAFLATMEEDPARRINCYSECLDVSIACIDSDKLVDAKYKVVDPALFMVC